MGWSENGELLQRARAAGFDASSPGIRTSNINRTFRRQDCSSSCSCRSATRSKTSALRPRGSRGQSVRHDPEMWRMFGVEEIGALDERGQKADARRRVPASVEAAGISSNAKTAAEPVRAIPAASTMPPRIGSNVEDF
jgi:hypothetical protein